MGRAGVWRGIHQPRKMRTVSRDPPAVPLSVSYYIRLPDRNNVDFKEIACRDI